MNDADKWLYDFDAYAALWSTQMIFDLIDELETSIKEDQQTIREAKKRIHETKRLLVQWKAKLAERHGI